MNHTLAQFERAALDHNAHIIDINKPNGPVVEMTGIIRRKKYKWNSQGLCFKAKVRVPEYDLKF